MKKLLLTLLTVATALVVSDASAYYRDGYRRGGCARGACHKRTCAPKCEEPKHKICEVEHVYNQCPTATCAKTVQVYAPCDTKEIITHDYVVNCPVGYSEVPE